MEPVKTTWNVSHFWARTPSFYLPEKADPNWKSVACGIAFESDKAVWISEGDSGKVRLLNAKSGNHEKIIDINQAEWKGSVTGDLAADPVHRALYVIDDRNHRLVQLESRKGQTLASVKLKTNSTMKIALSIDGATAWVANSQGKLGAIDVHIPGQPSEVQWLSSGVTDSPGADDSDFGDGGVLALADRIYVSNAAADTITVFSATEKKKLSQIQLSIPGLENLRGVRPAGLAFDPLSKWLLVAETGINAVGVIDTENNRLVGHIPVGLAPQTVAVSADRVFVANSQGRGAGPNLRRPLTAFGETPSVHRGSVSTFVMPTGDAVANITPLVYNANGFSTATTQQTAKLPADIHHVVLIVKGNRSFDEVLGDMSGPNPAARRAQATPQLARFGLHGLAEGGKQQFSVKDVAVTPNHHALAEQWAFSDNFYADTSGRWDEDMLRHLGRQSVKYKVYDERDPALSDQTRVDRIISDMGKTPAGEGLAPLTVIRLQNDWLNYDAPTSTDDHPYQGSWMADNDLALGRLVDYLSHSPWWRNMAVFITEQSSESGLDHVDAQRVPFLAAGPWIRRNYVSHLNSDSPGLVKTILSLVHMEPMALRDATARDLPDLFATAPDYSPFVALPPDKRLFDPQPVQK